METAMSRAFSDRGEETKSHEGTKIDGVKRRELRRDGFLR